jgi:hypothetical protein
MILSDDCNSNLAKPYTNYNNNKTVGGKPLRNVRKSKSSKDVLSDINSPKVRWKQNATIKEAVSESGESKKLEIKVKEDKEKEEEEERVRTPEQVRSNNNKIPSTEKILTCTYIIKSGFFGLVRFGKTRRRRLSGF